jgi:hypothetical protein
MKKLVPILHVAIVLLVTAQPVLAEEGEQRDLPWDKASITFGWFFTYWASDVRLDVGAIGVDLNLEEVLGLDSSTNQYRVGAMYRAWRRHRFSFNFYDLGRNANKVVNIDIPELDFEEGGTIGTNFDLKIYKVGYMCSFLQNEHFDLAAGLGFYVADINLDLETEAAVEGEGSESFNIGEATTLPLPVIGLHFQYAITHRIFLKQSFDFFYYADSDWDGLLLDALFAFEYNVWKYFGLGVGLDFFRVEINGTQEGSFLAIHGTESSISTTQG